MSGIIEKTKSYIKLNVKEVHAVEDVAIALNVSGETLRKEFRKREGISIGKFIKRSQVEIVKNLLANSGQCCKEILYEVGFPSEDSGARSFKRMTGMTMMEWRETYGNGKADNGRD
jgi:two-component system response regulator YesN